LKIDLKRIATLFVLYFSFACAGATERLKEEYSRIFSEPSSAKNIFANIKIALDENLLLRESFYEEKNIYWIIGDHVAREREAGENTYLFTSSKASKLPCPISGTFGWAIYEFERPRKEKAISGVIGLRILDKTVVHTSQIPIACEQFNIDELIKIFGPPNEERNIFDETGRSPPLHGFQGYVLGLRAHPLGNKYLTFLKTGPKNISYEIRVTVTGAGVVSGISVVQIQKEI
jgi:hypothetical protein